MIVKKIKLVPEVIDGKLTFATEGPTQEIELSEFLKEPEVIQKMMEMDFERLRIQLSMRPTGEGRNLRFK